MSTECRVWNLYQAPEAAAVAVLKRERSIAYDECARWFREAIRTALAGKE